jgi:hypothetical protein
MKRDLTSLSKIKQGGLKMSMSELKGYLKKFNLEFGKDLPRHWEKCYCKSWETESGKAFFFQPLLYDPNDWGFPYWKFFEEKGWKAYGPLESVAFKHPEHPVEVQLAEDGIYLVFRS